MSLPDRTCAAQLAGDNRLTMRILPTGWQFCHPRAQRFLWRDRSIPTASCGGAIDLARCDLNHRSPVRDQAGPAIVFDLQNQVNRGRFLDLQTGKKAVRGTVSHGSWVLSCTCGTRPPVCRGNAGRIT